MPARPSHEREEILRKFADKLDSFGGRATLRQVYEIFQGIENELFAADDDPMLYNALMVVRSELKEAMEARAKELGESDSWSKAMKLHDARLILNPLFRAQDDAEQYIAAYRAMSDEQRAALHYVEEIGGTYLARPEVVEAALRWNTMRHGWLLLLVPNLYRGTGSERVKNRAKAVFVTLLLLAGLALAIGNRAWVVAVLLFVLLSVCIVIWARDLSIAKGPAIQ